VVYCAVLLQCFCCSMLCCVVLCCAVLCCAVLCCAVLCCAVLCCAVLVHCLCSPVLCSAMPYYIVLQLVYVREMFIKEARGALQLLANLAMGLYY
jgi:hypothetical protein